MINSYTNHLRVSITPIIDKQRRGPAKGWVNHFHPRCSGPFLLEADCSNSFILKSGLKEAYVWLIPLSSLVGALANRNRTGSKDWLSPGRENFENLLCLNDRVDRRKYLLLYLRFSSGLPVVQCKFSCFFLEVLFARNLTSFSLSVQDRGASVER